MGRYLIIDTQPEDRNNIEWIETTYGSGFEGEILSEEETLKIFKYVWDKAQESHACTSLPEYGDFNDLENEL